MTAAGFERPVELTLVGTGHVFAIGAHIEAIVQARRPDIVCIELDPVRLRGLQERRRLRALEGRDDEAAERAREAYRRAQKSQPLAYRMLANIQERLADSQGVEPGSEMLAAFDVAQRHGIPVACIDVDARALVGKAWKAMGLRERIRLFASLLWSPRRKSSVENEIASYESDPSDYLAMFGDQFPGLKRVVIDDRDAHMASAVLGLRDLRPRSPGGAGTGAGTGTGPVGTDGAGNASVDAPGDALGHVERVVCIVGDGHVQGMMDRLRSSLADEALEIIRLSEIRAGNVPESPFTPRSPHGFVADEATLDGRSAAFHVDVDLAGAGGGATSDDPFG